MKGTPLTNDKIAELLTKTSTGRGPKGPVTEPRIPDVWFKLHAVIREEGCDNPECEDPRTKPEQGKTNGTNIVVVIKEKHMCRYCFLAGWLSDVAD